MKISKKELRKKSESLKNLIDDVIDEKIKLPKNALVADASSTLNIMTKRRLELINLIK